MKLFGFEFSTTEIVFISLAAYWLFSCLSYALPEPAEKSSQAYLFLYRAVHFTAANLGKFRNKTPLS